MKQKICLWVGNGATLDTASRLGLDSTISTHCDRLLPPIDSAKFVPICHEDAKYHGNLWRQQLWPNLWLTAGWNVWPDRCRQESCLFWRLATLVADQRWGDNADLNELSYPYVQLGSQEWFEKQLVLEFKFYLYYLFLHYQHTFDSIHLSESSAYSSPIYRIIRYLQRNYRLALVSHNYELITERLLKRAGYRIHLSPLTHSLESTKAAWKSGEILSIHPHGSIAGGVKQQQVIKLGTPPWLTAERGIHISGIVFRNMGFLNRYPPEEIPSVPEIVLPGSVYLSSEINQHRGVDASARILSDSDFVLSIGFNGKNADQKETDELVKSMVDVKKLIIVLRESDRESAGIVLASRKYLRESQFVFINETNPKLVYGELSG